MKDIINKLNNKKVIIVFVFSIICLLLIFMIIKISKKENNASQYSKLENALSNVFYFLDKDEYNNMNEISDFCKLALIYDTDYLISDNSIYNDNGRKIDGFSKNNIKLSIKNILGSNANINMEASSSGDYIFLYFDSCQFGNPKAATLTYDSGRELVYSNSINNSNRKVYVNWVSERLIGKELVLKAQALMAVQSDSGYDLYIDKNMEYVVGHYKDLKQVERDLKNKYSLSYNYEFSLNKNNNSFIWNKFKRDTNNVEIYE